MTATTSSSEGRLFGIGIWVAQTLIFIAFCVFGTMKLFLPVAQLAGMWVWPGDVPAVFLRAMGVIDIAGGLGVLLPRLTGIRPQLTPLAVRCSIVLQFCAIAFHAYRGEFPGLPLNAILLALLLFIDRGLRRARA